MHTSTISTNKEGNYKGHKLEKYTTPRKTEYGDNLDSRESFGHHAVVHFLIEGTEHAAKFLL